MWHDVLNPRLDLLRRLAPDDPGLLNRKKMTEALHFPSGYLPSIGLEAETFINRFPNKTEFFEMIKQMVTFGVKYDSKDSYPTRHNKWEIVLQPSFGTHLPLAREIQAIRQHDLLPLPRRNRSGSGEEIQESHDRECVPIHITAGIEADFPEEHFRVHGHRSLAHFYSIDRAWAYMCEAESAPVIPEVLRLSDCYLLARLFDATTWATSRERLLSPVVTENIDIFHNELAFLAKGFSGMTSKSSRKTELHEPAIEIRTCELWGVNSLIGFQKYLYTFLYIGAAAKSYSRIPISERDKILMAEINGAGDKTNDILNGIDFLLSKDKELARVWIELRKEGRRLYSINNLPDPMTEYGPREFTKLAYALPSSSLKRSKYLSKRGLSNQERFVHSMRGILTHYRSIIKGIIEG